MAFRTFDVFKLAGSNTPQPMVGSWITAGAITVPAGAPVTITLGTATIDTGASQSDANNIFIPGEAVYLIDPNGTHAETCYIQSLSGSANTLTLGPKPYTPVTSPYSAPVTEFPHVAGGFGTGTFIMPRMDCNNILLTYEDGGTGPFLYIGNAYNMTATFRRIFKLPTVTSGTFPTFYNAGMFSPGNPFNLSELWVFGTANDEWNVSVNVD